ncbi:MAG: CBS domain-containing protein [Haloplanus sp.]
MSLPDLMRTEVVTCAPETPVYDVATAMRDETVGCVVVVVEDRPVGIVTDRDVTVRLVADDLDAGEMTAGDVMTEAPRTVGVDTGVFDLAVTMNEATVRRMPVVDDGALVGIVTLDDLLVLLGDELETIAGVVASESPAA